MSVGLARSEVDKDFILGADHNIGLGGSGSSANAASSVLEVNVEGGTLAGLVGEIELEDSLDLLDLSLTFSLGHGLNASPDLVESSSRLEVSSCASSCSSGGSSGGRGSLQGITLKLNSGVRDDDGVAFDRADLEEDLVALAPHGGLQSLTRVDSLGEADLDVLERSRVVVAVGLEDVLTSNTERAETMENWNVESSNSSHIGVDVERVPVAGETVQGSLIFIGLLLDNVVGLAAGSLVNSGGSTTVSALLLASKAASATDEHGELVDANILAVLIDGLNSNGGDASLALVQNVNNIGSRGQLAAGGERLDDLEVLLTMKKHHGVERGEDLTERNTVHGSEGGDDTKGGDRAESLVVLIDKVEVLASGTNTQVVQNDVALLVLEDLSGEGQGLGSLNVDLAIVRDNLGARSITINVLKVGHNTLHRLGSGSGVGGAAILEIGDLGPHVLDVLRQQRLVDGEAVAASTLPAKLADETSTNLEDGAALGGLLVAKVLDQGGDHLGLQGSEHVWGEDSLGHARGSHRGDNVAGNVVLLALKSQGLGQSDESQLSSRVVGLTCLAA